jgi:Asp/Glu/hydantoin racemase
MRSFATIVVAAMAIIPLAIAGPSKSSKPSKMDAIYYKPEDVMNVDVVIIGGGGMGACRRMGPGIKVNSFNGPLRWHLPGN